MHWIRTFSRNLFQQVLQGDEIYNSSQVKHNKAECLKEHKLVFLFPKNLSLWNLITWGRQSSMKINERLCITKRDFSNRSSKWNDRHLHICCMRDDIWLRLGLYVLLRFISIMMLLVEFLKRGDAIIEGLKRWDTSVRSYTVQSCACHQILRR